MPFNSENQPVNRKSGPNIKAKIIAALGRRDMTEEEFLDRWLDLALGDDDTPGGGVFMAELLKRYSPIAKQTFETVIIEDWPKNGTPAQKSEVVLNAMADGTIPFDLGTSMIESIAKSLGIEETTDLAERLAKLEELMKANG